MGCGKGCVGALLLGLTILAASSPGLDAGQKPAPATASAARVPAFRVDPAWPLEMPNNWILGAVTGVFVDAKDHVWVTHLPETLTDEGLRIVSGGTDNHLMLVDLRPVSLTGKEAEARLDAVGITVNKNAIPYDPEKPFVASGIRVGTPAMTTCGMKEEEAAEVARLIARTLKDDSPSVADEVRAGVSALTDRFRPYPDVV